MSRQTIGALDGIAIQALAGSGGIGIVISGTFVGTLQFEGTIDNKGPWISLGLTDTSAALVSVATAPGSFRGSCSGLSAVRVRASAWTSGSASIGFAVTAGI